MNEQSQSPEINLDKLKEELAVCEKQRDEYLDGWKRTKADFINYKKEESDRFGSVIKFSNEALILELLNIMNSLDLGLTILKDDEPTKKGMQLIKTQLEDLLGKYGLEKITISRGQLFDPKFHEAVEEIETDEPANTIFEEAERGYVLHGKVIRPSKVKLAKGQKNK